MKTLIAVIAVVALAVLGFAFLYASKSSDTTNDVVVSGNSQNQNAGNAASDSAQREKPATQEQTPKMEISSPAFAHNSPIPSKYTCDGQDINPPLTFANVPSSAKELVLIVDDPDAPAGVWTHWVVYNIPPQTAGIDENSIPANAVQGTNSWGKSAYGGPCPPSGTHRYFFKLYALNSPLQLSPGASKTELENAMQGKVIASAELVGTYTRQTT